MAMSSLAKIVEFYHCFYERKVPLSEHRAVLKAGADLGRKCKQLEADVASLKRALEACEADRNGRVNALDEANARCANLSSVCDKLVIDLAIAHEENARINARIADAIQSLQS